MSAELHVGSSSRLSPLPPIAAVGPPVAHPGPLRLELARCPICPEGESRPIAVGEDFEYRTSPDTFLAMQCVSCGLVYLRLRPAESELGRIYPPEYHAFDFSAEKFGLAFTVRRRLEARRLLRFCRGLAPDARILDVGCGDGFHLKLLRDFGAPTWQLEGVDTSDLAVAAGRRAGLVMHQGAVETLDHLHGRYDMALLIATVEHVAHPVQVLDSVRKLLRPGGRVAVVTDNAAAWSRRLFEGRHWGGYHFPRHFHLFTPPALRQAASLAGLSVVRLDTIVSPVNWVYSIRNKLVDHGAPGWLVNRFSLASPGSLAAFTLLGSLQQMLGRGELLAAVLQRPEADRAR